MKKTLVALAAVAATTAAMADVTVFGIVDQAYARDKGTNGTTVTAIKGTYTGSELGFKGSEDLGNGLTGDFQIHFAPSIDGSGTSNAPTAYQSHVGVKGAFGGVRVGQFFSSMFSNNAAYDSVGYTAFGYNVASGVNAATGSGVTLANSIEYTLPTLVSGLGVTYVNSQGESTAGDGANNITNYRLNYGVGAFSVGYAAGTKKGTSSNTKETSVGVSYDLGLAKLAYYNTSSKVGSAAATTGSAYGVSVPFGATTLGVQASSSAGTTGTQILVKHDLTKRTSAIFQNGRTKVSAGTTNGTSVGLWHSF